MNYSALQNKSIALLIWNTEMEDDIHVYLGQIVQDESGFKFINEAKGWRVSLSDRQMAGINAVSAEAKEVL